jgi:hypothetical protein
MSLSTLNPSASKPNEQTNGHQSADEVNAQTGIWPIPIPIIGVTGEYSAGKTLFGLTIDPSRTLIYDTEKSAESYRSLSFERKDVPTQILEDRRHRKLSPDYKPVDTFLWWREHALCIPPGKYSVIVLDTASEIESGAVDWVRNNPGYFNRTLAQYVKMSGLLWGDMKEFWKAILSDLASRCQTFVFTVHMGDVWVGDKPSGKRKPKGKSTLMELASLFLQMERKKDAKGNVPAVPSALVLKSRLAHTAIDPTTGEVRIDPVLPPRLPIATPCAIRQYMLAPPDYSKLTKAELAPEEQMTEDERAGMRLATAEAEAEREKLALEREERQRQAADRRAEQDRLNRERAATQHRQQPVTPTATPQASQNGNATPAIAAPGTPVAPAPTHSSPKCDQYALDTLVALRSELFGLMGIQGDRDKETSAWRDILAKRGVTTAKDLTREQARELSAKLKAKTEKLWEQKRGPVKPESRF